MHVKELTYERLVSVTQYENHRGSITLQLEPGDDFNAAFEYAKAAVSFHMGVPAPLPWQPMTPIGQ